MPDISSLASAAEKVVEGIETVEPAVAGAVAAFVPGAAPVVAAVQPWVPAVIKFAERSLLDIASKNGGDMGAAVLEFIKHITAGESNSPTLSAPPAG